MKRATLGITRVAGAIACLAGCASTAPETLRTTTPAALPTGATGWTAIGASVNRRPIEAVTVGEGPIRILVIGGIHGDESESLGAIDPLVAEFASAPATIRFIRDLNPDGTAARRRTNANGVDLNRNFPASNFSASRSRGEHPLSEPEAAALKIELDAFRPDLVVVCHSTGRGPFVNYDGPAADLAAIFADGAAGVDDRWRVVADMGYATPGSLGSYVGVDMRTPILTIEMRRGQSGESALSALRAGLEAIVRGVR